MSALGALVLGASVFVTWYRTDGGIGHGAGAARASTLDGLHALPALSVVLLVLAGLALIDVLTPLARTHGPVPGGAGGAVVLLGLLAAAVALYRMVDPPSAAGQLGALSLREGAWMALIGALMVALGGMWPRYSSASELPGIHPGTLSWN